MLFQMVSYLGAFPFGQDAPVVLGFEQMIMVIPSLNCIIGSSYYANCVYLSCPINRELFNLCPSAALEAYTRQYSYLNMMLTEYPLLGSCYYDATI